MHTKVYVDVKVDFDYDGNMRPREITREDGHKYEIDRILDVCPAAALKAGVQGDRFTIISNHIFGLNAAPPSPAVGSVGGL